MMRKETAETLQECPRVCESVSGVGLNQAQLGLSSAMGVKARGHRCAQVCRRGESS